MPHIGALGRARGRDSAAGSRGAAPEANFAPMCFLLTDSACLGKRVIAVGITDDALAAVMVIATL